MKNTLIILFTLMAFCLSAQRPTLSKYSDTSGILTYQDSLVSFSEEITVEDGENVEAAAQLLFESYVQTNLNRLKLYPHFVKLQRRPLRVRSAKPDFDNEDRELYESIKTAIEEGKNSGQIRNMPGVTPVKMANLLVKLLKNEE
jgi:hypothetical protein